MCSSLSVAGRGWRIPCSQLSTALELTFSRRANSAWLALRAARKAWISAGFSGLGRGGISTERRSRLVEAFSGEAAAFLRLSFLSFFLLFLLMAHLGCHNVAHQTMYDIAGRRVNGP